MQAERRREPRLETSLWIGIPEVEGEPELEECNISASGMLLKTPRDAGAPGAVRMLHLVTADLAASIEIMAQVVRVVEAKDENGARVLEATGFDFLPHQPEELETFMRQVLDGAATVPTRTPTKTAPRARIDPPVEAPRTDRATDLSVLGMLIDTNCAVESDAKVTVTIELPSSQESVQFSGRVLGSRNLEDGGDEDLYSVEVGFDDFGELRNAPESSRAAENASGASERDGNITAAAARGRAAGILSGNLSEIALPSLLGFFDLERASGILQLGQDGQEAVLFVKDGSILDVEMQPPADSAENALATLLEWPDGAFVFTFQSVERDNVIGKSTTALLMDCAQQSDEKSRGA